MHVRVPLLASIEDLRAAQGGSLKGCPVRGGKYGTHVTFFTMSDRTPRSWPWYFKLPKVRRHPMQTDGVSQSFRRQRRLLVCFILQVLFDFVRRVRSMVLCVMLIIVYMGRTKED